MTTIYLMCWLLQNIVIYFQPWTRNIGNEWTENSLNQRLCKNWNGLVSPCCHGNAIPGEEKKKETDNIRESWPHRPPRAAVRVLATVYTWWRGDKGVEQLDMQVWGEDGGKEEVARVAQWPSLYVFLMDPWEAVNMSSVTLGEGVGPDKWMVLDPRARARWGGGGRWWAYWQPRDSWVQYVRGMVTADYTRWPQTTPGDRRPHQVTPDHARWTQATWRKKIIKNPNNVFFLEYNRRGIKWTQ